MGEASGLSRRVADVTAGTARNVTVLQVPRSGEEARASKRGGGRCNLGRAGRQGCQPGWFRSFSASA